MNNSKALKGFFKDAERILALPADVAQLKQSGGGSVDLTAVNAKINTIINPPSIGSFSISGNTTVEVGQTVNNNVFNWTINNASSVKSAKIQDSNNSNSDLYSIPTADIGSGTYTLAVGTAKTAAFTQTYRLNVIDGNDKAYNSSVAFNWCWAVYSGSSASTSLDEAGIEALTKALKSGYAGTYTFAASAGYKYIIYPTALGTATTFKDASTGLNVPMSAVTTLSITNANGVTTTCNVHRTTNIINGAINIAVSS